ncbi:hypothetical protein GPALN_004483 [Globodera pallida]|nr:hypothetical protein GPALN_004483 [Globodera pallida]
MLQESLRRWLFGFTYEELSDKSATVLETFRHWLHPQSDAHRLGEEQMPIGDEMSNVDELSDEMRQIVKFVQIGQTSSDLAVTDGNDELESPNFVQVGQTSSTNVSQISDLAVTDGDDELADAKTLPKNNGKNILEQPQQQQLQCVVCCDNKIETVYVPCGHACTCQKCADTVGDKCPICRSDDSWPIRIFLS